jgi:AraC-like DNA-binding protein
MLEQTRPDGHGRARGLVSSPVSGARVEARTYAPAPELRDVVEYYWITRWDLIGASPHVVELLGDPCVHLVFEPGQSRVVGVSTRLWRRELSGRGGIRAAKLRAGAARTLLDAPVIQVTDRVIPIGTVLAGATREVESRVLGPQDDQEALGGLERWLAGCVRQPCDPKSELAVQLVEYIAQHEDMRMASQLAARSGLGLRPLQRLFRDYVGASPKWVIRRHRLQEAALRLERGGVGSLATLAADLGYADHAHLSRELKAATGRSPSELMRDFER